jgi:hypothetical protein
MASVETLENYVKRRLLEITPQYSDAMLPELMPLAWSDLTLAQMVAQDADVKARVINAEERTKREPGLFAIAFPTPDSLQPRAGARATTLPARRRSPTSTTRTPSVRTALSFAAHAGPRIS